MMQGFFSELQRRHVYKVGAMYCVTGWLLVQIATQVLPIFDVTPWAQRIVVIVTIAGFPLAVILAWTFDITRKGVVRTPAIPVEQFGRRVTEDPAPAHARAYTPVINRSPTAAIAEDEALLRGELKEMMAALWPELVICAEAENGYEALQVLERDSPDILFLDIRMPGLTGLEVAARASGRAHVVFITAYDEHAIAAFEQGAVDYILKPVNPARLAQALTRLRQRLRNEPANLGGLVEQLKQSTQITGLNLQWINVLEGDQLRVITISDICYCRSLGQQTNVVTATGEYRIAKPLLQLEKELGPELFWRADAETIVNSGAIEVVNRSLFRGLEIGLRSRRERLTIHPDFATSFSRLRRMN